MRRGRTHHRSWWLPAPCRRLSRRVRGAPGHDSLAACGDSAIRTRSAGAGARRYELGRGVAVMAKRINELAKEWGVQPKDVITAAEQLGIKGKRSQSAVTDDETARLRQALGLARPAQVTVGAERVV